jgi:hypothetical protein
VKHKLLRDVWRLHHLGRDLAKCILKHLVIIFLAREMLLESVYFFPQAVVSRVFVALEKLDFPAKLVHPDDGGFFQQSLLISLTLDPFNLLCFDSVHLIHEMVCVSGTGLSLI